MGTDLLLELLENVVPVGLVALVGIGIYFMKTHQENMKNLYETNLKEMRFLQQQVQENHGQQIAILQDRINDLKGEIVELRQDRNLWRQEGQHAAERFLNTIKDLPDISDGIKSFYQSWEERLTHLPQGQDNPEIQRLWQDLSSLKQTVQKIDRIDEKTKTWFEDIETFSRKRESLAQRAKRHADQTRA